MERKYADPEQRMRKTNRYILWGGLIILLADLAMLYATKVRFLENDTVFDVALTVCVVVSQLVMVWAAYKSRMSQKRVRMLVLVLISLLHVICNSVVNNSAVNCMIFAIAFVCVLYYDKKFAISYSVLTALYVIVNRNIVMAIGSSVDILTDIGIILLSIILLIGIVAINTMFSLYNKDIFGVAEDANKEQGVMIQQILEIAAVVENNTMSAEEKMKKLEQSTGMVLNSMEEIAAGTMSTAQSIQSQTEMTQEIQRTIQATAEKSQNMVDVSADVRTSVKHGTDAVKVLNVHTEDIVQTSRRVVENMESLQKDADEMKNFADMILEISTQTNLLALNASIESARAGEAGRGFAVVADQIRVLAEQTLESTQSITELIGNLTNGTSATAEAINKSVNAMNEQVKAIAKVDESFNTVEKKIEELGSNVSEIDGMMKGMVDANNTIIESISQLSATSEEITASTESTMEIARQNRSDAVETQDILGVVAEKAVQLNQYQNK